jgi:hypothetical protein
MNNGKFSRYPSSQAWSASDGLTSVVSGPTACAEGFVLARPIDSSGRPRASTPKPRGKLRAMKWPLHTVVHNDHAGADAGGDRGTRATTCAFRDISCGTNASVGGIRRGDHMPPRAAACKSLGLLGPLTERAGGARPVGRPMPTPRYFPIATSRSRITLTAPPSSCSTSTRAGTC